MYFPAVAAAGAAAVAALAAAAPAAPAAAAPVAAAPAAATAAECAFSSPVSSRTGKSTTPMALLTTTPLERRKLKLKAKFESSSIVFQFQHA